MATVAPKVLVKVTQNQTYVSVLGTIQKDLNLVASDVLVSKTTSKANGN